MAIRAPLWSGDPSRRADYRPVGFPEGLAAFLCLGFPRLGVFLFGGNPRHKNAAELKKRQDSESRQ